jgi:hypothetical protein
MPGEFDKVEWTRGRWQKSMSSGEARITSNPTRLRKISLTDGAKEIAVELYIRAIATLSEEGKY